MLHYFAIGTSDLKPMKGYYGRDFRPFNSVTEPEDQWLSEKDVLSYIKEHPAFFHWIPVTLNIPENLALEAPKDNSTNTQPVTVPQNSAPGTIRGMPARKFRHITAMYFLISSGKDTYEGQKLASELVKNGLGIEFIPFIYFDAQRLGQMAQSAEMQPMIKDSLDRKRTSIISEYCSASGRKGLPPFPNRDLLLLLLDLHPATDYEPNDIKIITSMTEPEDQWLSEQDVMKYVKEHPALPSKPPL
jgi:hypothetical protein